MSSIGISRCKMYNAASKCLESCVNMQFKKINSNNFVEHEKMKMTVRNFKVLDCSRRQRLNRQALEIVLSRLETMHGFARKPTKRISEKQPRRCVKGAA